MLLKSRLVALALAVVMLFSACACAQGNSVYLTISDPYFTDGTNAYDLTGLAAQVKLSANPELIQLLLSVISQVGAVNGAVELTNDAAYLYADGFSSIYGITLADLSALITAALGRAVDLSVIAPANLDFDAVTEKAESAAHASLNETIAAAFMLLTANTDQLANAQAVTVNTFTQTPMTAYALPLEHTAEEIDAELSAFVAKLDATGIYQKVISRIAAQLSPEIQAQLPPDITSAYQAYVQPLQIAVNGFIYYGENDVFADLIVYSNGVEVLPLQIELVNGDSAAVYIVSSMVDEAGEGGTLYATIETNTEEYEEYIELGALEGETPIVKAQYVKIPNAETGADEYAVYFGMASDTDLVELSGQYASDSATFRNLYAGINISGVQFEISYDSQIAKGEGAYEEKGVLSLNSNMNIAGKVNLSFGSGAFDAASIIPTESGLPMIDLATITEEQSAQLSVDAQGLLSNVMVNLIMGVPGFAALFAPPVNAQG